MPSWAGWPLGRHVRPRPELKPPGYERRPFKRASGERPAQGERSTIAPSAYVDAGVTSAHFHVQPIPIRFIRTIH